MFRWGVVGGGTAEQWPGAMPTRGTHNPKLCWPRTLIRIVPDLDVRMCSIVANIRLLFFCFFSGEEHAKGRGRYQTYRAGTERNVFRREPWVSITDRALVSSIARMLRS